MYTSEKSHELHSVREVARFTKWVDFNFLIAIGSLGWTKINFWLAVKEKKAIGSKKKYALYVYLFSLTTMKKIY